MHNPRDTFTTNGRDDEEAPLATVFDYSTNKEIKQELCTHTSKQCTDKTDEINLWSGLFNRKATTFAKYFAPPIKAKFPSPTPKNWRKVLMYIAMEDDCFLETCHDPDTLCTWCEMDCAKNIRFKKFNVTLDLCATCFDRFEYISDNVNMIYNLVYSTTLSQYSKAIPRTYNLICIQPEFKDPLVLEDECPEPQKKRKQPSAFGEADVIEQLKKSKLWRPSDAEYSAEREIYRMYFNDKVEFESLENLKTAKCIVCKTVHSCAHETVGQNIYVGEVCWHQLVALKRSVKIIKETASKLKQNFAF